MWEEPRWKVLCLYNEGVYIAKGDNWPLWPFDFPHECLTSCEFSTYMILKLHMCISWTFTLHDIWLQKVRPIVGMWPKQLMTQLDMTRLSCTGWLWCPRRTAMMLSDGCAIGASCLHLRMARCTGSSMVLVFAWWCTCICPFGLLLDVLLTFVQLWASLLACAPSSSCLAPSHVTSMYLFLQTLMTRRHQIQKYPSLAWCIVFRFGCRSLRGMTRH